MKKPEIYDELYRRFKDDWRWVSQDAYMLNASLEHRRFYKKLCKDDYLHCGFCWDGFSEGEQAYFEPIKKMRVYKDCFADFSAIFRWKVTDIKEM